MVQFVKKLLVKYREQWSYLIVGALTTLVNYIIYFGLNFAGTHYMVSNVLAWIGAVIFAYFANGRWVYRTGSARSWGEAGAFVLSRVFSLGLESLLLLVMVDWMHVGQNVAKIITAVVVVVVNYLTGLLVYKRKRV